MQHRYIFQVWSLGADGPQKCLHQCDDWIEAYDYAADHPSASGFGCGIRDTTTNEWCLDEDWLPYAEAFGKEE